MIIKNSIAVAVAGTLLGIATTAAYMKSNEGVPSDLIFGDSVAASANLVTALKQDEGVPQNLVTALKQDEGVPGILQTAIRDR